MDRLQQRLCARVKAGVDWRDIHLASVHGVAGLLRDGGVVRCTAEQAVESGIAARFFPHGIGHLLGLQVHDVGGTQATPEGGEIPRPAGHPALRLTRRLEAGFVVTMEPGLYFIDALLQPLREGPQAGLVDWARVEALRPCGGIRIEDDLAVTADGLREPDARRLRRAAGELKGARSRRTAAPRPSGLSAAASAGRGSRRAAPRSPAGLAARRPRPAAGSSAC